MSQRCERRPRRRQSKDFSIPWPTTSDGTPPGEALLPCAGTRLHQCMPRGQQYPCAIREHDQPVRPSVQCNYPRRQCLRRPLRQMASVSLGNLNRHHLHGTFLQHGAYLPVLPHPPVRSALRIHGRISSLSCPATHTLFAIGHRTPGLESHRCLLIAESMRLVTPTLWPEECTSTCQPERTFRNEFSAPEPDSPMQLMQSNRGTR